MGDIRILKPGKVYELTHTLVDREYILRSDHQRLTQPWLDLYVYGKLVWSTAIDDSHKTSHLYPLCGCQPTKQ